MLKGEKKASVKVSKKGSTIGLRKDNVCNDEDNSVGIKETTPPFKTGQPDAVSEILSDKNLLYFEFDVIKMVAAGGNEKVNRPVADNLGISPKSMAEDILNLSIKTMERKLAEDKLDKKTSSHAIEIARVMNHAFQVFEDGDKVKRWINRDNKALNGMKPIKLFDSLTGLNLVNDILGRIEEGVYS